ncbi:MAG: hypothetical protein ACK5MU_02725 [Candidatus Saccharimonadales bacterium]
MEKQSILSKVISVAISGKVSIAIYIGLFIYLVILPLIALIPGLEFLMPSSTAMLVGGNYTNVLAALGASLAAGTGIVAVHHARKLHKKHVELEKSIKELHEKIDKLSQK